MTIAEPLCVGALHLSPLRTGAGVLRWHPVPAPERLRVFAGSCERCADVWWEYGSRGGAYLIRRTEIHSRRRARWETPAVRRVLAAEWWDMLVRGRAA
ncbi:hypothetical protein [Actinomadura atramentaria]|uniref:hypothetical protein n=1 Tax=Actinomadura atramentaria TaxID=1990 RepID=UPI0003706D5E|nr:hypothetical protein [Actinomadura atramentaria]